MPDNIGTNVVIPFATSYINKIMNIPYTSSVFSIFNNNAYFEYPLLGNDVKIRIVSGGNASDYDQDAGFTSSSSESGGSVTYQTFYAPYDRKFVIKVDAMREAGNLLQGWQLNTTAIVAQNFNKYGAEIDAVAASTIYDQMLPANRFTTDEFGTDKNNILDTLVRLNTKLVDAQWGGKPAFVMMSSDTYANFTSALIENSILANAYSVERNYVLHGTDAAGLAIDLNCDRFMRNLYIFVVPAGRMYSSITLLDGNSDGQLVGGFVADDDAKDIKMLVLPREACAISFRHIASNITVPYAFQNMVNEDLYGALDQLSEMYGNSVRVNQIGIDQTGDWFKYMARIVYGVAVFNHMKETIFAVTEPPELESIAVEPTTLTVPLANQTDNASITAYVAENITSVTATYDDETTGVITSGYTTSVVATTATVTYQGKTATITLTLATD